MERTQVADDMTSPLFVSLGSLTVDELYLSNGGVAIDILGGSGPFSTCGARIFCDDPESSSSRVGLKTRVGQDFVVEFRGMQTLLERRGIAVTIDVGETESTTRRLLRYENIGVGKYIPDLKEYTTSENPAQPSNLGQSNLLPSQAFHFSSDPSDFGDEARLLSQIREDSLGAKRYEAYLVIWEPRQISCFPSVRDLVFRDGQLADIIALTRTGLAGLFGVPVEQLTPSRLQGLAMDLLYAGQRDKGFSRVIIVHAGGLGTFVITHGQPMYRQPLYHLWSPEADSSKIVDPTGSESAFLGAFAVKYLQGATIVEAAQIGAVAASFVMEQIGFPKLKYDDVAKQERWNDDLPMRRLEILQKDGAGA